MRSNNTYEQINTIALNPENGQWVSFSESRYASTSRKRKKLLIACMMIGVFFSFYNPMTTYKQPTYKTVDIEVEGSKLS